MKVCLSGIVLYNRNGILIWGIQFDLFSSSYFNPWGKEISLLGEVEDLETGSDPTKITLNLRKRQLKIFKKNVMGKNKRRKYKI